MTASRDGRDRAASLTRVEEYELSVGWFVVTDWLRRLVEVEAGCVRSL